MNDMKQEFNGIKQAIAGLAQQVSGLAQQMAGMAQRIDARFDAVEKDLYSVKMVLTKSVGDVSRLDGKFDDFSGRSALHAETLLDHDKRIRTLEKRLSS